MLLSEMFEIERDTDFKVKGYESRFRLTLNVDGFEQLKIKHSGSDMWETPLTGTIFNVISVAPTGIIHLPPPLTDEQREQLRALYTLTFRWIVKNKKGVVIAYSHKPYRYDEYWATENVDANIQSVAKELSVCSLVSWSDNEPYDISKALGVKK